MKAHCSEPLNEAADALTSAAAEADDSPLPSRLHLETNSVHFYINRAPVQWGARLHDSLIQVAADCAAGELGRPKGRSDGSEKPVPITTAWMLRQDQGRQVLCKVLRGRRTDSSKQHVLQPVDQHNHVCEELSARILMERKREACPSQTEEGDHGHKRVSEDSHNLIGQALFQR